jgi:hypothetical protein
VNFVEVVDGDSALCSSKYQRCWTFERPYSLAETEDHALEVLLRSSAYSWKYTAFPIGSFVTLTVRMRSPPDMGNFSDRGSENYPFRRAT